MRYRTLSLLAAFLLTIGFGPFLAASSASAASGIEICDGNQCLNAWNGGPEVNAYAYGVENDSFAPIQTGILSDGTYVYGIQFYAPTAFQYDCIGDMYNSPTDARAGLYSNCGDGHCRVGRQFHSRQRRTR